MAASPIELNRIRRPPPLAAVRFFTEEEPPTSPDLFQQAHSYEDDQLLGIQPPWRRELFQLLEQATSSGTAFFLHMFLTFLIVFSALVTIMETVPAVHSISTRVWFGVETTVVVLFTMEYIARCLAWSSTWSSLFYWVICEFPSPCSRTCLIASSFLWRYRSTFRATLLSGTIVTTRYREFRNHCYLLY